MPRDQRLYITVPIDFHRHPKVRRLPVDVRWTFLEMNLEAKIVDNDGRFSVEDAEFMWPIEHLDALVKSHPSRPLVIREHNGGDYVIREYAEHQQTKAEREALAAISRENGRKGGRPRKRNPDETQGVSEKTQAEPSGTRAKAESESRVQSSEDSSKTSTSQSPTKRASGSTDAIEVSEMMRALAGQRGIRDLAAVAKSIRTHTGRDVDAAGALAVATWLAEKSSRPLTSAQRYVTTCIRDSALEVQQYIDEASLARTA